MKAKMTTATTGRVIDDEAQLAGFGETVEVVRWLSDQNGINSPLVKKPDRRGYRLLIRSVKMFTPTDGFDGTTILNVFFSFYSFL